MMQKLQLSIPEPCHENWQQMTPTEQGRFCNACAKEVVDFSKMTDIQVLNYFSALTHQKVCGRALPEQLNRPISRPDTPKKRLFWYWNYIVMFFMLFGKGNAVKAQGSVKAITEFSPAKQNDVNKALAGWVGQVAVKNDSRVITGKVTDIDGNPVSFASIKIKGTNMGISADANGAYSFRVKHNDVLFISAASFKSIEVPVGLHAVINSVLEASGVSLGYMVITHCYFGDGYFGPLDKAKQVAVLKVKDEETGESLSNVSMIISSNSKTNTALTDKKGMHKIKGIKDYDKYFIKAVADGYESAEFAINSYDFKDRKKEWEVLLRKKKVETINVVPAIKEEVITKALCVKRDDKGVKPLMVVDGIIMPAGADIDTDDVEDYIVLKASDAIVIYGKDGSNGAIVITTRKTKEKTLDTFTIYTEPLRRKISCGIRTSFIKRNDILLNDPGIKDNEVLLYPNPVQRGEQVTLSLKLKQRGLHQIQLTDAVGRIVLQKQINAVSKEFTEKILADASWSSGIYYISITDTKNQLVNKSSFIVR